jgi:hypothetical protein
MYLARSPGDQRVAHEPTARRAAKPKPMRERVSFRLTILMPAHRFRCLKRRQACRSSYDAGRGERFVHRLSVACSSLTTLTGSYDQSVKLRATGERALTQIKSTLRATCRRAPPGERPGRSVRGPGRSAKGQIERFPAPWRSASYSPGNPTFAAPPGGDGLAPIPALDGTAIERPESTHSRFSWPA